MPRADITFYIVILECSEEIYILLSSFAQRRPGREGRAETFTISLCLDLALNRIQPKI